MQTLLRTLIGYLFLAVFCQCQTAEILVIDGRNTAVYLSSEAPEYVQLAVGDLLTDIEKITDHRPALIRDPDECPGNCILIGTLGDRVVNDQLDSKAIEQLQGQWERYSVTHGKTEKRKLVIAGSSPRGTMFGIYHFLEKQLGVDPLYFWTGYEPEKRTSIELQPIDFISDPPDFKFRGWFINDEDLLTEWKDGGGQRQIDYPYYGQVVAPEVIQKVAEAAVRLRYNLMIPASFVDIRNPAEERLVQETSRRGLFLSMHHIEPVGVSAFGYQNYWAEKGESPLFSFYSAPDKLEEVWRDYARRWAKYPDVIWQIGLRGIADRPMWMADPGVPQSDADRGRIISEAMAVQKKIIQEVTGNSDPLISTTLWAEGAHFNQKGLLEIPEGVMVIFADNSPGWVWQPDFYETERDPAVKYGIYYHHQLWGSGPHLVQAVPPAKTFQMFQEAQSRHSDHYAIMNVSNIREFPLALQASAAMQWNMDSFDPDAFLQQWCRERFPEAPEAVAAAYLQFFASYQLVGDRRVPGFLDGQQRSRGLAVLRELEKQLKDPVAYLREQSEKGKTSGSVDPFHRSLSDTHPTGRMSLEAIQPKLQEQLAALEKARQLTRSAKSKLSGEARQFFAVNLEGQIDILSGLGEWLAACIKAKQAANRLDLPETAAALEDARTAFNRIEAGQEPATLGKWSDWYRGDKKMNLPALKGRTTELLDLALSAQDR